MPIADKLVDAARNRYIAVMSAAALLTRDAVLTRLRAHAAAFHAAGVDALYVFGSVARDEATAESDVDIFIDPGHDDFSLLDLVGVQMQAAELVGAKVDIMTRRGINRHRRARIEAEALRVF